MAETGIVEPATVTTELPPVTVDKWRETLPDDIKDHASLKDLTDIPALAKRVINAEAMVGADKVAVPGKAAPKEEWDTFWNTIGRPEKPEGYVVPTENMPDGHTVDEPTLASFKEEAHRIGLTDQQGAALLRFDANRIAALHTAHTDASEKQQTDTVEALKKDWGDAFDQNLGLAKHAIKEFGGDELVELFGNDLRVVKTFHKIGKALASDEIKGGGGGQNFAMGPEDARREISRLKIDKEFTKALQNNQEVGHKAAIKRWDELFAIANPEP